jgi:hypothetical protein
MAKNANNAVAVASKAQSSMIEYAELPRTLMGGTWAMRKARQKYLPKEEAESQKAYENRLSRTTLFNAFAKTVGDMTGKVFAKEIAIKDNVPNEIKQFVEDIDLTGRHLNVFAHDVFLDGIITGGGYILVDLPPSVVRDDGATATLADEAAAGLRPFMVYIPIENLIGWKSSIINGAETLTMVRIKEYVTVDDGEYAQNEVEQVKVLQPGSWETFRKNDKAEWVKYDSGTSRLPKITLVPVYINRTGFMTFSPPLDKLADINVAHWQSQSDQRNILHIARVPILFWSGKQDTDQIIVGANSMMYSSDVNSKLQYVEHTGAAIDSGDKDLQNLEKQMQAMGLQLLIDGPGGQTATGERRDDEKENSPLAKMARSLGDAIEQAFGYMAEYLGLGTDKGGEVEVNTDYGVSGTTSDLQYLTQAAIAGKIDNQTYIEELKRRKTLGESVNVEVVLDRIASSAPAPGSLLDLGPSVSNPHEQISGATN